MSYKLRRGEVNEVLQRQVKMKDSFERPMKVRALLTSLQGVWERLFELGGDAIVTVSDDKRWLKINGADGSYVNVGLVETTYPAKPSDEAG